MLKLLCIFFLTFSFAISAKTNLRDEEKAGFFSGRVSKVNLDAGLVRIKVDFTNQKYINKKDKVEFWDEHDPTKRCKAYVVGKTSSYILLRIPEASFCSKYVFIGNGAYVKFYSQDLANNLRMGRQLVDILLKKHMALKGKLDFTKRELDNYLEKVNTVNSRYKVLRDKLELEWRDEIGALEQDESVVLQTYRNVERKMDDVNYKLERYRIEDDNLKLDRWALDPMQHYKK